MNANAEDDETVVIITDGANTTVITNAEGPINTGSGDQFTGDGLTVISKNSKGISQVFPRRKK